MIDLIPIGTNIIFKVTGNVHKGRVTKQLLPGYQYSGMPLGTDELRYCIEDLSSGDHNYVIVSDQVIGIMSLR